MHNRSNLCHGFLTPWPADIDSMTKRNFAWDPQTSTRVLGVMPRLSPSYYYPWQAQGSFDWLRVKPQWLLVMGVECKACDSWGSYDSYSNHSSNEGSKWGVPYSSLEYRHWSPPRPPVLIDEKALRVCRVGTLLNQNINRSRDRTVCMSRYIDEHAEAETEPTRHITVLINGFNPSSLRQPKDPNIYGNQPKLKHRNHAIVKSRKYASEYEAAISERTWQQRQKVCTCGVVESTQPIEQKVQQRPCHPLVQEVRIRPCGKVQLTIFDLRHQRWEMRMVWTVAEEYTAQAARADME